MIDDHVGDTAAANGLGGKRTAALEAAIGVLYRLDGPAARNAVEIRRILEAGQEPDARLVRSVESALLVGAMSPKLRDEDTGVIERRGFLATASGVFGLGPSLPTRQQVQRCYKEFSAAFSKRASEPPRGPRPSPI